MCVGRGGKQRSPGDTQKHSNRHTCRGGFVVLTYFEGNYLCRTLDSKRGSSISLLLRWLEGRNLYDELSRSVSVSTKDAEKQVLAAVRSDNTDHTLAASNQSRVYTNAM